MASTGTTATAGTLQVDGSFTIAGEMLTLNGGSISVTGDNIWSSGIVVVSSGSINIAAGRTLQATVSNSGTGGGLSVNGGLFFDGGIGGILQMTGINSLAGTTVQVFRGGTLQVESSLTASNVFLSGGILRGSGTVTAPVFLRESFDGILNSVEASGAIGNLAPGAGQDRKST